jgi:hypothetical protein
MQAIVNIVNNMFGYESYEAIFIVENHCLEIELSIYFSNSRKLMSQLRANAGRELFRQFEGFYVRTVNEFRLHLAEIFIGLDGRKRSVGCPNSATNSIASIPRRGAIITTSILYSWRLT